MNIVAIIPARGGSKGIKDKNIIDLNNKPLIIYTIEIAKKISLINNFFVKSVWDTIKKRWKFIQ